MIFAWAHVLWLLLLPAAWLVWELTRGRKTAAATSHPKILRAEVGTHDVSVVRDTNVKRAAGVRPWLLLGLTFSIVALARPQWGNIEEPVFDQAREILLAVDLSRSMLSPDVKPSRLDRSKLLIQALLEKLQGERVGLIVFSGTAFLQSPLSSDYEILREFLPALGPDFLPEGGTNYRALIDTALDAFSGTGAADRFLIILSDGEATDDEWRARVDELKKKGVRVIGLGIGTVAGTMIPDGSGGFVKDARGAVVMSKLESATLQNLANATDGTYRDASTWIDLAGLIQETVNAGQKGEFTEKNTLRRVDRFQWPLALALWCFLVSCYYEFPVRPRTRDIALRPPDEKNKPGISTGAALAIAAIVSLLLWSAPTQAAIKPVPLAKTPVPQAAPPPGSAAEMALSLGRIVGRLSKQETLSVADASELGHETVNWGRRVREAHAPVPPGPVVDALAAMDQVESRGNKPADWSQLRKDLEELLQRPPPPPEQQQQQQQQKQQDKSDQKQDQQKQQDQNQSDHKESPDQQQQQPQEQKDPQQNQQQQQQDKAQPNPQQPTPPKSQGDTQKVGGAPEKNQQKDSDPSMTLPMEKLEQLKNQDSPAQLFQMMQPDRSKTKKPQKDW